MSAAAGVAVANAGANTTALNRTATNLIREELVSNCRSGGTVLQKRWKMRVKVGDTQLTTVLMLKKSDEWEGHFDLSIGSSPDSIKNCIQIHTSCEEGNPIIETTMIMKDSDTKKCFTPVLQQSSLPARIRPTDILATLRTKLCLILSPAEVEITDMASVNHEESGNNWNEETFDINYLSVWKLLRGELSIYEKYGYLSHLDPDGRRVFDKLRDMVASQSFHSIFVKLDDDGRIALKDFLKDQFPTHFGVDSAFDKTVQEVMREINYDDTFKKYRKFYITNVILSLLLEKFYDNFNRLTLDPSNPKWIAFDSLIQILSLEPESAGGGRNRRRTARRRPCRVSRKNRSKK